MTDAQWGGVNPEGVEEEAERIDHLQAVRDHAEKLEIATEGRSLFETNRKKRFEEALASGGGTSRFPRKTAGDYRGITPMSDIVEGIVAAPGTLNMLSGWRGSMKSLSGLSIAGAVCTGMSKLWERDVNLHCPVLLGYRESPENLSRRIDAWEAYYGQTMTDLHIITEHFDLKRPEDVQDLALHIKALNIGLFIVDPVARTGGGKEDAEDFGLYRLGLEALIAATGVAILVLHNTGHGDKSRGRGHSTLEDAMNSCISLERQTDEQGGGVELKDTKGRDAEEQAPLRLAFEPAGPLNTRKGVPWSGVPVIQDSAVTVETAVSAVLKNSEALLKAIDAAGDGGITRDQAAKALGVSGNNVARALTPRLQAGVLRSTGSTKTLRYHRGPNAPKEG